MTVEQVHPTMFQANYKSMVLVTDGLVFKHGECFCLKIPLASEGADSCITFCRFYFTDMVFILYVRLMDILITCTIIS